MFRNFVQSNRKIEFVWLFVCLRLKIEKVVRVVREENPGKHYLFKTLIVIIKVLSQCSGSVPSVKRLSVK